MNMNKKWKSLQLCFNQKLEHWLTRYKKNAAMWTTMRIQNA